MGPAPFAYRLLPLGVLRRLAGLLQAVLLRLLLTRVAREKSRTLERAAELGVHLAEAAGDAEAHGTGLARDPASVDRRLNVVGLRRVGHAQRLGHQHAVGRRGEVLLDRK